jgi:glycosyltransferase involved in cell wall biosynthesis
MPRVLMWVPLPPPFAGPEVASQLLSTALRTYLADVVVENATVRTDNLSKGTFDLQGVLAAASAQARFARAARRADIVYMVAAANEVGSMRDAALIATARAMRKRVVLHLRGGRYDEFYREAHPALQLVLRRAWGAASLAIVQSPRLANMLAEAAPHVPIAVLPNGLPPVTPKQTYGAGLRVLFVGHLIPEKGFYDLVAAVRMVDGATLVCAGELPRGLKVDDPKVEHVGMVTGEAKAELFRSADLFVLPSRSEGFSLAMLEAMAYGLPVIATRVGAAPDVIREHNGILVEAKDIWALAEAIEKLRDPALREAMGRRNARDARELYDLDTVASRLAALIEKSLRP